VSALDLLAPFFHGECPEFVFVGRITFDGLSGDVTADAWEFAPDLQAAWAADGSARSRPHMAQRNG
jgi:hypothetical protein